MLNKIIEFSVGNKLIIGLFVIALIGLGIYETTKLPIDAVPDITNNQVQIITVAPSFGATDIERLVTFPIEQANSNIEGIQEIRSFSRFGLSLVTIVFNDETDTYWARQQVAERLLKVQNQIPAGIGSPELAPISTGLGEIYQYVVRPKKGYEHIYDETELRTIQDWIVRRQLLGIEGVAEVSSFGGKLKQYEIAVNPNKLQSHNVTINEVFKALEQNNQNTGGAYIEKGPTVLFIRSEGLIENINDIENINIKLSKSGLPILIRDVAEVKIGFATRYGAMCYNDQGEVAGGIVMMLKGANSSEVIENIKSRVDQIQSTLPEGVVIEPFLDRTKMVNNAIGTVETNLIEGALIVVFVLVIFLGNFRAGLIVASVIPLSMLFAIILMNTFGVSGNLMSLGALDFGLIVDGAVIIVEAVMHQISHNKRFSSVGRLTQSELDVQVNNSASKMMNSAVFGQIIILIVYLPIFTLQGIEGKMFKPMAQTVAFALLGAFILSLTYVPMISALLLSKKLNHKKNISDRIMSKVENIYSNLLSKFLRFQKSIIIVVLSMFTFSIYLLTTLGGEFIPELEEGDFAVETRVLTGSNLNTTIESTQMAAHVLLEEFPEIEKIVTKIGSGEVPTDPMPMEASDLMVILKDKSEWTSAGTFDELAEKMSTSLKKVPGITTGFQFPVQMRFNELMTGARQDIVCKIFGEHLDTLAFYAEELNKIIKTVNGCENIYVEPITGMPQIIIDYNRSALAEYNLSIEEVNKVVNTAFAGQSTGLVFEGEKRFELVVKLENSSRENLNDVRNLLIPTTQNTFIPLNQLAEINIINGPNQIQREDAKRRIVVGFNVNGRDIQSIVNELQEKVKKKIKLPTGYFIKYGGAFENLNAAKQRLMIAVPISLILIFLLLFFAFRSIKHGLLIYTAIPLSAIGGILFLSLRDMPFSISAGVGFIALFGVAVLNGIVLISEYNRLKKDGYTNLFRVVIMGTKLRLRPVLMTAFVASLGFLPMALSNGSGAEVQRPLATVVIGGLMIATLLTLFLLPILYILLEKKPKSKTSSLKLSGILLFPLFALPVAAQQTISLKAAIDTARKNNLTVRSEQLKAKYNEKLIATSKTIPQTQFSYEYGQLNSVYNDDRLGISQTINFPTIYSKQKEKYKEEWFASVLKKELKEYEIINQVTEIYYEIIILKSKELLLIHADSNYFLILEKIILRQKLGESPILEKTTVETQIASIQIQLQSVKQNIELKIIHLQLLLNSKVKYEPELMQLKLKPPLLLDSAVLSTHPSIAILLREENMASIDIKLERSKFLPELNLSYYNMRMQGNGADNNYYSTERFQSAQIGIGVPLFFGAQKARLEASKIQKSIASINLQYAEEKLLSDFKIALLTYKNNLQIVEKFENDILPNIIIMKQVTNQQFNSGEINFIEWVILTNQTMGIQNNYYDAIQALNESINKLNYFTLNNN